MSQLKEQSATLVTAAVVGLAAAAVIAIEGSLAGEAFLFVDGCFIALVWGTARWTSRWTEGTEAPPGQWPDPYLLGYLAGGPSHAIHTATLALVVRGLLHAESDRLTLAVPNAADLVERPIEQGIVGAVAEVPLSREVFLSAAAKQACEAFHQKLVSADLIRGSKRIAHRALRGAIAAAGIVIVAVTRYALASSRGLHKFGFLGTMTIVAVTVILIAECADLFATGARSRTRAGDALLADMRRLFGTLPQRAQQLTPGGATNELSFLVALFGVAAAPAFARPLLHTWAPQPPPSSDSPGGDGGDSSSSSCSSSSCGGGGGCGGCGG